MKQAFLVLEDGTVFEGKSLGASGEAIGEIVFSTAMTGYLEAMTDPSYAGQLLTLTYPIIGNYGINREDALSDKAQIKGLIIKEAATHPNNFRCQETLEEYLLSENVIAICGIDTRALTKKITSCGTMNGIITTDPNFSYEERADELKAYRVGYLNETVSTKEKQIFGAGNLKVSLVDYGLKKDTIASLIKRGATVTVYPAQTKAEEILAENPDGIMLSNGPGDPNDCRKEIIEVKKLMESKKPVFGIGLGHQLMALSLGAKTEQLKFGHRGASQPVLDLLTGKTFVTSQNHGYVVLEESLNPQVSVVTHKNVNDKTVEGIRYLQYPAFSVQFHPEAKPGPTNEEYLYGKFFKLLGGEQNA